MLEAKAAGYGGIAAASRATGMAVSTIGRALRERADGSEPVPGQIRRPGGGRKPLVESDTGLMEALLALVEPSTRGDPETPTAVDVQERTSDRRAQSDDRP
jgi:hypothetical protein